MAISMPSLYHHTHQHLSVTLYQTPLSHPNIDFANLACSQKVICESSLSITYAEMNIFSSKCMMNVFIVVKEEKYTSLYTPIYNLMVTLVGKILFFWYNSFSMFQKQNVLSKTRTIY